METNSNSFPSLLSGRYRIISEVGTGGMARVFLARDLNLQRDIAIKVLRDDLIHDPDFLQRFMQEARAVANLSHPNIVTVYDFGHDQGRYFIVMEYIAGTDLKTLLRRRKQLSLTETLDFMIKICAGVGYAHRTGLVHCDLKPQNILITPDNQVRVTDFGISRALVSIDPNEKADIVWGSPLYLAPELSAGRAPSPASDVYALGVMQYEMLAGSPPFIANDPAELAYQHQTTPPPSVQSSRPEVPAALDEITRKVLAKEPSARYRTADQLGQVLSTYRENLLTSASQAQPVGMPSSDPDAHTMLMETTGTDDIDWLAVLLGLIAFLAVGGLIPLWLLVCVLYPSCPLNPG